MTIPAYFKGKIFIRFHSDLTGTFQYVVKINNFGYLESERTIFANAKQFGSIKNAWNYINNELKGFKGNNFKPHKIL